MIGERHLLAVTLATNPSVGSNLRGEMAGGGWLYALPRLEHGLIVCVGLPPAGTLAALSRSGEVRIVEPSGRRRRRIEAHITAHGWPGVSVASAPDDEPIDLLVLTGRTAVREAARSGLWDRLAPEGLVYAEPGGRGEAAGGMPRSWPGTTTRLHLTPFRGEPRGIVPAADRAMVDAIHRLGLEGSISRRSRLARLERRLLSVAPLRAVTRRGALLAGAGPMADPGVPAYLRAIATAAGRDLRGWRWAVAARGDYDSQKILILLAPPDGHDPVGVAKVTRSAAHAGRLQNEAVALAALAELPLASDDRVPAPWFAGSHVGRAVLGESLIEGVPFGSRATFAPDDPLLADALGWLADLAEATLRPAPAVEVADVLLELLARYERIYTPGHVESRALRDRFERLSRLPDPIPTVMQHGDPGIWNLLAGPGGRATFLDWEAAETTGMPLWDLLYCFRSYAVASSRRSGVRDRLEGAARHLLEGSPLGDVLVDVVDAHRRRIALPVAAIEPLIFGCWIHRALKEASRLAPDRLGAGQSVRLLRRMLERPDAPMLARLSGLGRDPEAGA